MDRVFMATANSSGQVALTFTNVANGAKVSGIEVFPIGAASLAAGAGGPAAGPPLADSSARGGAARPVTDAIDTSGVAGAAPASVYQGDRSGYGTGSSHTIPGLAAGRSYRAKPHFAETYHGAGRRRFDVSINGAPKLDDLDVDARPAARTRRGSIGISGARKAWWA